jgi:hypothetical protein
VHVADPASRRISISNSVCDECVHINVVLNISNSVCDDDVRVACINVVLNISNSVCIDFRVAIINVVISISNSVRDDCVHINVVISIGNSVCIDVRVAIINVVISISNSVRDDRVYIGIIPLVRFGDDNVIVSLITDSLHNTSCAIALFATIMATCRCSAATAIGVVSPKAALAVILAPLPRRRRHEYPAAICPALAVLIRGCIRTNTARSYRPAGLCSVVSPTRQCGNGNLPVGCILAFARIVRK